MEQLEQHCRTTAAVVLIMCLISQLMDQNVTSGSEHLGPVFVCLQRAGLDLGWGGERIGENIIYKPSDPEPSICAALHSSSIMMVPALLQTSLLLWLAQETLQGGKDGARGPNYSH